MSAADAESKERNGGNEPSSSRARPGGKRSSRTTTARTTTGPSCWADNTTSTSGGAAYAPGGPYVSMAGRDAGGDGEPKTDAGNPDYEPDDGAPLNPAERASLALWVASFEGKYVAQARTATTPITIDG